MQLKMRRRSFGVDPQGWCRRAVCAATSDLTDKFTPKPPQTGNVLNVTMLQNSWLCLSVCTFSKGWGEGGIHPCLVTYQLASFLFVCLFFYAVQSINYTWAVTVAQVTLSCFKIPPAGGALGFTQMLNAHAVKFKRNKTMKRNRLPCLSSDNICVPCSIFVSFFIHLNG